MRLQIMQPYMRTPRGWDDGSFHVPLRMAWLAEMLTHDPGSGQSRLDGVFVISDLDGNQFKTS